MTTPGMLSSSQLTAVTDGAKLSVKTARAYNAMREDYPKIHLAGPYAGYRSAAVQNAMHAAGLSAAGSAARRKYNLSSASTVSIAAHPNGTHETGTRVDLVGMDLDDIIRIAKKYGFTREFGAADPNHFIHDGKTAVSAPKRERPGKIEHTLKTGEPNEAFYKNLQWYGSKPHGTYEGPIDGDLGTLSWKGVQAHLKYDKLYTGKINGKEDAETKKALQRLAARYGYTGPIDGDLGVQSYIHLSEALNRVP